MLNSADGSHLWSDSSAGFLSGDHADGIAALANSPPTTEMPLDGAQLEVLWQFSCQHVRRPDAKSDTWSGRRQNRCFPFNRSRPIAIDESGVNEFSPEDDVNIERVIDLAILLLSPLSH